MKKYIPFVLSLILSLMVFFIPWGFCFFPHKEAEHVENTVVLPKPVSVLIAVEDEEPLLFLRLTFKRNSCEAVILDKNLKCEDADGNIPISDIYLNGGLKYCLRALNRSFSPDASLSLYASISLKDLSELLKPLGRCDISLSSPVFSKEELLYSPGRYLFNVEDAVLILKEGNEEDIFLNIVTEIFNQRGKLPEKEKERIFNILSNGRENNLSASHLLEAKKYRLFDEGFKFYISQQKK